MSFVLALDQGTTSSRALVFDRAGAVRAVAQKEFRQHFPQPGWVEHDAAEIWSSQAGVAAEALAKAGIEPAEVAGIGITNQRETTVVWDRRTGRPVHHAIVWQDRRTAPLCDRLREAGHEPLVREKTGLLLDPYFSGTKVRWILDNVDGARQDAEAGHLAFGTVDSWLVWNLTGGTAARGAVHVTDVTNASRTLLFNLKTGDWDDDLLALLDVPRAMLPEVHSSSEVYARTTGSLLSAEVPIAGIAGDQHAALFGQRCTRPGLAKNTYGTGCFLLLNTGDEAVASENGLVTTAAWQLGDAPMQRALEGSVFVAGAAVQWLRDGLGVIQKSADVEALAQQVDSADGVVLVPALTGLGAPHWDPDARGTLVGLTRGTTAAHLARATLDGIAFQVADVLQAMQQDAGIDLAELRVDGGASQNDLLMQIQADLLQTPLARPAVTETTALGAAFLAGLAVGFWDEGDLAETWQLDRRFEPQVSTDEAASRRHLWARAVERARDWAEPTA